MEHVKLNVGNVIVVGLIAVVFVGATGAIAEYAATKVNVPLVTPLARGYRQFLGWSLHEGGIG
jgi:hypothetical protein